ncbi:S1 RNA-binding domain-containing protein [Streptomyces sp. NPDC050732]|uniref:S1 RNA-binding domain-containing protein n=1 Tax=Streptomyces sp. NPDC050732 TaxID=3154632 RepID=UPI003442EB57
MRPALFLAFADSIAAGRNPRGPVTEVVPFGAFGLVGDGIEGLVPLREPTRTPVRTPSDAVQVGDEVTVVVAEVDRERRRLGLSRRQASTGRR